MVLFPWETAVRKEPDSSEAECISTFRQIGEGIYHINHKVASYIVKTDIIYVAKEYLFSILQYIRRTLQTHQTHPDVTEPNSMSNKDNQENKQYGFEVFSAMYQTIPFS